MSQMSRPLLARDEAIDHRHQLVSSRRVEGTDVYNRSDHRLGSVHSMMIDKKSGQVAYVLLAFGGLFGLGGQVHALPWAALTYDPELDAFVVDLSREEIEASPRLRLDRADRPLAEDYQAVEDHYSLMPWLGL